MAGGIVLLSGHGGRMFGIYPGSSRVDVVGGDTEVVRVNYSVVWVADDSLR